MTDDTFINPRKGQDGRSQGALISQISVQPLKFIRHLNLLPTSSTFWSEKRNLVSVIIVEENESAQYQTFQVSLPPRPDVQRRLQPQTPAPEEEEMPLPLPFLRRLVDHCALFPAHSTISSEGHGEAALLRCVAFASEAVAASHRRHALRHHPRRLLL